MNRVVASAAVFLLVLGGCSVDLNLPSASSDVLPQSIDGYVTTTLMSGNGTGFCTFVDMATYHRPGSGKEIRRGENVNVSACISSQPERRWREAVADLRETSSRIREITLDDGIHAKLYSPYDKHAFILWRDGQRVLHASSFSESGNGYDMAVEVANAVIRRLRSDAG